MNASVSRTEAELTCGWWVFNRHEFGLGSSCSACFTGFAVLTSVKGGEVRTLALFQEVQPDMGGVKCLTDCALIRVSKS